MSYITRVTGGFRIEPPIRWSEIKASGFRFSHAADPQSVQSWRAPGIDLDLIVDMREQDHEDGESVITTYAGVKLVMRDIDEYRADGIEAQVQRVVDMFDDDHAYEGHLDGEGEGGGWGPDVWRLKIEGGKARKVSAIMMYPEDLKAERTEYAAGLLRKVADEVNELPQDHELDPGRGESAERLREWADKLDAGEGPDLV